MKKKLILLLTILSLFFSYTYAQALTSKAEPISTSKPKIMVIPYTHQGEDIRMVLESDVNKRIALTKIKEAFDKRGYTTVDFFGRVKALSKANALGNNQQQDVKSLIIQQSGADIYVETEISILDSPTGNSVKIIMSGYDISTGNSLANAVCESGKFYTDDYGKLASRAIDTGIDVFLNSMQNKLMDMAENGQSISLTIGFAQNSMLSMSTEVGDERLPLSDDIEMFVAGNSYKENYHIQGTSDKQMIFDDIRIPLTDVEGRTFNANKFGLKLLQYFRSRNIKIERSISNNMIVITIK